MSVSCRSSQLFKLQANSSSIDFKKLMEVRSKHIENCRLTFQNWSAPSALLTGEKFKQTGGFSDFSPTRVTCNPCIGNKGQVDLFVGTVSGGFLGVVTEGLNWNWEIDTGGQVWN